MSEYARTLEELKKNAVLHWPKDILAKETAISVLPLLLETQDKFISVLTVSDAGPDSWCNILKCISMKSWETSSLFRSLQNKPASSKGKYVALIVHALTFAWPNRYPSQ